MMQTQNAVITHKYCIFSNCLHDSSKTENVIAYFNLRFLVCFCCLLHFNCLAPNNIAVTYSQWGKMFEATENYEKSLTLTREQEDVNQLDLCKSSFNNYK